MAIKIVEFEFPIKHGDFPWQNVNVHQRVHPSATYAKLTLIGNMMKPRIFFPGEIGEFIAIQ